MRVSDECHLMIREVWCISHQIESNYSNPMYEETDDVNDGGVVEGKIDKVNERRGRRFLRESSTKSTGALVYGMSF
jgi:hypothetical protein